MSDRAAKRKATRERDKMSLEDKIVKLVETTNVCFKRIFEANQTNGNLNISFIQSCHDEFLKGAKGQTWYPLAKNFLEGYMKHYKKLQVNNQVDYWIPLATMDKYLKDLSGQSRHDPTPNTVMNGHQHTDKV